jgi:glycosyltransferase involved in cell wall biosynthesis
MNLKFSIVIPTYNRAHLIRGSILSVLAQSYSNWELIIVDDGSTDHTKVVVDKFVSDRVKYVYVENGERGRARNIGIENSSGNYVTFLDSDDQFFVFFLQNAYDFISSINKPVMVSLAYEIKEVGGKVLNRMSFGDTILNRRLLNRNILSCIGVFLQREIAMQYPFCENRNFAGTEDWLLWLKLSARYPIYHLSEISASLIQHEERSVLTFNEQSYKHRINILEEELMKDKVFMNKYSQKTVQKITGHMYTYTALHAILNNHKTKGLKYFLKGILLSPSEILTRRTLGIIKHLIVS